MNGSYHADESDSMDTDEEESNTQHNPPNSPTPQVLTTNGVTQQGQPTIPVARQCSYHAADPHPVISNHPHNQTYQPPVFTPINQSQNQNRQLPTVPPHSYHIPSVLGGTGNAQPSTTASTHQGQAQGSENVQPQNSSGQSSDVILHPVHSGPARREAQAQQDALVENMDNMNLDPSNKGPN